MTSRVIRIVKFSGGYAKLENGAGCADCVFYITHPDECREFSEHCHTFDGFVKATEEEYMLAKLKGEAR